MVKKIMSMFVALCIVVTVFSANIGSVLAEEDTTAPVLTSIEVLNKEVTKPGIVKLKIGFIEDETGLARVGVICRHVDNHLNSAGSTWVDGGWNDVLAAYTGDVIIDVPIKSTNREGIWKCDCVYLEDAVGNSNQYEWLKYDETTSKYYLTTYYENEEVKVNLDNNPTFTVKDEFDTEFEVSLTNPNLVGKLDSMETGKAGKVLIDDNSNGIAKKEIFDAIKGKDKTVIFYKDAYKWVFNGLDITEETKDINLLINVTQVNEDIYGTNESSVKVEFADNGVLPGKAEIRLKSDYLYYLNGIYGKLNLYYLNGDDPELQQNADFDLVVDGTDRWCNFTITHNSSYAITGSKAHSRINLKNVYPTLSKTKFTYNGKKQRPKVKIKGANKSDYIVHYGGNCRNIGKYSVYVKGRNKCYGKSKKVYFYITPKGTKLKNIKSSKKSMVVTWKKQAGNSGYQIQYSTKKNFSAKSKIVKIKGYKQTSKKITKLKSKTKYFVRVRTYYGRIYSSWSKAKAVKIK